MVFREFRRWVKEGDPHIKELEEQLQQVQENIRVTRKSIARGEANLKLLAENRTGRASEISTSHRSETSGRALTELNRGTLAKLLEEESRIKKVLEDSLR